MSVLFENADILATENGKFKYIRNAYLGISNGIIDYIGTEKPENNYKTVRNMYNKMLIPGLINAHGHSAMNLLKGVGSDLALQDWLNTVWAIEDTMKAEDFTSGMSMAILEMLSGGITTFSDMYFMPFDCACCIEETGIKANLTKAFMSFSREDGYETFADRTEGIRLYRELNGAFDDRLHIDFSIHAEYTNSLSYMEKWAMELNALGAGACFQTHLSETKSEHEKCIEKYGKTPAALFEDLGFFNLDSYVAHCVWVTEDDIEIFRRNNVTVVHNPTSNMKLASGFAPVPRLIEKEVNVALGTDGSSSNNNINMFEEMHLASIIHKGYTKNPVVVNPRQVVEMATVNGARALGRRNTGSLEIGKDADIVAINLDAPHMIPNNNPCALITYSAQASDVCMTMVNGKILYENGHYPYIDRDRIFADYRKALKRIYNK